jgi:NadR type nicotinamide-nucleotide adenylyltransferase
MRKILFTGPESTGKTRIAQQLAEHYQAPWVPEYARTYLEKLSRPYGESDLIEIARGQIDLEDHLAQQAPPLLFCDTSMIVMKVWSEFKYGRCHPWIIEQLQQRHYDLIVLCGIDIPWTPDPQRENPEEREELYRIYQEELRQLGRPYLELQGGPEERLEFLIHHINHNLT